MARRATLSAFLKTAKTTLAAPPAKRPTPLTFVVGNESADLDSLCSAILYAYVRSHAPPHRLHIPLSNLPREDLALRSEMTAVLGHAGLGPSDLLTLSELPDLPPSETRWLLVDHNALTGPLKKYAAQVEGCVDHHVDEKAVPEDASPRVVEPCGSCMSLVVDECQQPLKELLDDPHGENDKLVRLSLAPILLDTINLTAEAKVCDKDISSVSFLEKHMRSADFDRAAYYDLINAVKEDISNLSFRDILRKDYKQWEDAGVVLGVSCVVQGFEYLLEKAGDQQGYLDAITAWADERHLDVAAVMTTSHPAGEFRRQLLVWGITETGQAALQKFLAISSSLQLEAWNGGELDAANTRHAWRQHNLAASRKQVAPLLRDAIKSAAGKQNL